MPAKHLLIAEDDDGVARLVSKVATRAGYEIRRVSDGLQLTNVYHQFQPDVIVLDVLMPNMDGIETLQFLNNSGSKAHIVILSGQESYRCWAKKMGLAHSLSIVATVSKPFRVDELEHLLENIIAIPANEPPLTGEYSQLSRR